MAALIGLYSGRVGIDVQDIAHICAAIRKYHDTIIRAHMVSTYSIDIRLTTMWLTSKRRNAK